MRQRIATMFLVICPAVLAGACVGGSKDAPPPDMTEALKQYTLDKEPDDLTKLGISYDNKVTLIGAKVDPSTPIHGGDRVKVTMYWKCEKELGEPGWKLFTHVTDGSGERILNIDNVGPLRHYVGHDQALGPSTWKVGKVYVDEQEFTVPKKVKTSTINVTVGVWKGDERLPVVSGPKERDNRGIAATIHIAGATGPDVPPAARVPELRVDKLEKSQKITIDGKLDEEAWKTAASTGPFVEVATGRRNPASPIGGSAKLLWDEASLYVGFEVKDKDIQGGFKKDEKDPHLWTKDTVEIMVDPDGDGDNKDYYEIQVGPQNLVFDSQFDSYNTPKKEPDGPFGHQEWSAKLKSAVTLQGTIDKSDDVDTGYTVEIAIPWKSFDKAAKVPPELGQSWRMNFYAMENNGGEAWSPILGQGNFHRASRFGKVTWAAKGWTPPAPPTATGTPAASGAPAGSAAPSTSGAPAPSAAAPAPKASTATAVKAPAASAASAH